MSVFLFLPPKADCAGRRIDLANIGRLFAEIEEPSPARDPGRVARIALMALILLGAIGDTVLVARREVVAGCLAAGQTAKPNVAARS